MTDPDLLELPPLTERQASLLLYIARYFRDHRYMPTQREMCEHLGIRSTNAQAYVRALEQKGYVARRLGRRRNLKFTPAGTEKLRLLGQELGEQRGLFED